MPLDMFYDLIITFKNFWCVLRDSELHKKNREFPNLSFSWKFQILLVVNCPQVQNHDFFEILQNLEKLFSEDAEHIKICSKVSSIECNSFHIHWTYSYDSIIRNMHIGSLISAPHDKIFGITHFWKFVFTLVKMYKVKRVIWVWDQVRKVSCKLP